jgi:hypothetical protein
MHKCFTSLQALFYTIALTTVFVTTTSKMFLILNKKNIASSVEIIFKISKQLFYVWGGEIE